jgi:TolB protein
VQQRGVWRSSATNLLPNDRSGVTDVFVRDPKTHTTGRVSVSSASVQGDGAGFDPALTPAGRFVSFPSNASNLVPIDTNGATDIFFRGPLQ